MKKRRNLKFYVEYRRIRLRIGGGYVGYVSCVDGGYYAIKGFSFQYDKTIIHILERDNETELVEIEVEEDLSDSNFIIQVKYKEKANYYNSSIKEPVCKLLEKYNHDKRNPVLYSFFKDKAPEEKKLSIEELNAIIGNGEIRNKKYDFDDDLKNEFIQDFKLIFTKKYYEQLIEVIRKIKDVFDCSEDEALIYYPLIYKYVEEKVTSNPPGQEEKRICTKKELIDHVKKSTKVVFDSSYMNFLGKEKYLKLIKKKYFTCMNLNYWERFFVIDLDDYVVDGDLIKDICVEIKGRYYSKKDIRGATHIKSPAPYIFFKNIDKTIYKKLKQELLSEEYIFRDGFCFEDAEFNCSNLIEECTSQNNIEMKFINEIDHFNQAIEKVSRTKKVYYFYKDDYEEFDICSDVNFIKLEELKDILQVI